MLMFELEVDSKIYIAGHQGLVGSAIFRHLKNNGYKNFVLRSHSELELTDQDAVNDFFKKEKPEYVFLAAAKVGGILANSAYPAQFIYSNLAIQVNIVHSCYLFGVKKLLFLGSSCIYPRLAPQPMTEDLLLSGPLEPTNQWYAIAKISGILMCQGYNQEYKTNFISVMPTNLYGPNDHYDLYNSHVLPALIRKFYEAKINNKDYVQIWGTGNVKREFLYVDDMAEACVFLMNTYNEDEIVNIGTGNDVTIRELAELIKDIVGFEGKLEFDFSKPDGMPRKLLNVEKINALGWRAKTELKKGLELTFRDFKDKYTQGLIK